MPISQIYDDGTVDIFNSKTGETRKKVRYDDLAKISPNLVSQYHDMQSPEKKLARLTAESDLKNLESGGGEKTGTAEQEFKKDSAVKSLEELEMLYGRGDALNVGGDMDLSLSPGSTPLAKAQGRITSLIKTMDNSFQEDWNVYSAQRAILRNTLNQALGAGVPQEVELKALMESMPNRNTSGNEAKRWFESAKRVIGDIESQGFDLGGEDKSLPPKPGSSPTLSGAVVGVGQKALDMGGGVLNFMLGNAKRTFQDIAQAIPAEARNTANQKLLDEGVKLAEMADKTDNLADKEKFLKQAQSIFNQVSQESSQVSGGFSEDVGKGVVQRSLETGIDIAGGAGLVMGGIGLAKNPQAALKAAQKPVTAIKEGAKKVTGALKDKPAEKTRAALNAGNKLADKGKLIRNKAIEKATAQGKTISGEGFVKHIEEWGEKAINANPSKKAEILKKVNAAKQQYSEAGGVLDASGKAITKAKKFLPDEAKAIWDEARKGFKSSGAAGNTIESSYHRAVRDFMRGAIDEVAPGFEKGTKAIKAGIEEEKILKTVRNSLERADIKEALKSQPGLAKKIYGNIKKALGVSGTLGGTVVALDYAKRKVTGD